MRKLKYSTISSGIYEIVGMPGDDTDAENALQGSSSTYDSESTLHITVIGGGLSDVYIKVKVKFASSLILEFYSGTTLVQTVDKTSVSYPIFDVWKLAIIL